MAFKTLPATNVVWVTKDTLLRTTSIRNIEMYLWESALQGSLETLEKILMLPHAGECVNFVPEKSQYSVLMAAVKSGSLGCVKLLLYHGANISYQYSNVFSKNVNVINIVRKEHHVVLEQYLKDCMDDFQKCGYSRAYLEMTVKNIASKITCTSSDIVKFLDCLRDLLRHCSFDVNSTVDEENNEYTPLLLRAADRNNSILVTKLLCDFNASYQICDPFTGENLLHVCFKKLSKLRFYFVLEYPSLLYQGDRNDDLPLFIPCKLNDVEFFEWLFRRAKRSHNSSSSMSIYEVVRRSSVETVDITERRTSSTDSSDPFQIDEQPRKRHKSFLALIGGEDERDCFEETLLAQNDISIPDSPTIGEVFKMKPFSTNKSGKSILHILTVNASVEILTIFCGVCDINIIDHFDMSALCVCHKGRFPIENAIASRNPACVRAIIDLSIYSCHYSTLLQEKSLLKAAVVTKNIENVKILIRFGFHADIKLAITVASTYKLDDILRLLFFWQTQTQSYLEILDRHLLNIDCQDYTKKTLSWQELVLQHVSPTWIYDTSSAMKITSKLFSEMSPTEEDNNFYFFVRLGEECLKYFENENSLMHVMPDSLTEGAYHKIVSINLSDNLLERVPEELFQLASLTNLDLRCNQIDLLPSSEDLLSNFYSAKIKTLLLDYNLLTCLPDNMIWGLANSLTDLSAQNNKLESIPPGLWLMPKLTTLRLARNELSSLHYLSDLKHYRTEELVKDFSSFHIGSGGALLHPEPIEESPKVSQTASIIKKLAALSRTVSAICNPRANFTSEGILQEVISMHEPKKKGRQVRKISNETPGSILSPFDITYNPESVKGNEIVLSKLHLLDLSNNKFKFVPWNLPCLIPDLPSLNMTSNQITSMDIIHDIPQGMRNLNLKGNKIANVCQARDENLSCGSIICLLATSNKRSYCNHSSHKILEHLNRLVLDDNLISHFPVLKKFRGDSDLSTFSYQAQGYPLYPNLATLSLVSNCLTSIPEHLHFMKHLGSIDFSKNVKICELPEDIGLINTEFITRIGLEGIIPRNVPKYVLDSASKLVKYLRNIKLRAKPYRHIKLMLVGDANKGKTSLLLNLVKRGKMQHFSSVQRGFNGLPLATVGVDLGEYEYSPSGQPSVKFMTWDFGGQEEYYATHQCFLTKRSLYLLLWNIQDGEKGLESLRHWLENIGSCAPRTPVIVVATHLDLINPKERDRVVSVLQAKFDEMYISSREIACIYPSIAKKCFFIDIHNPRLVDQLRDIVYNHVVELKSSQSDTNTALLDELIPESYVTLQKFVRDLAKQCSDKGKLPVYTKRELMKELSEAGYNYEEEELEDASSFLHENGILLNYDDSSFLADLYFIDPQWLCQMLAKIITIRYSNPYCDKGSMWMEDVHKIYPDYADELINLLKKFEVVHKLDDRRILIPSLLPDAEENSCILYPSTILDLSAHQGLNFTGPETYDRFWQTNYPIYCRYYLLPFVPDGFFTRLIARLMSCDVIDHLYSSLVSDPLENFQISTAIHWRSWRNGIVIIWNQKEILRVAPLMEKLVSSDVNVVLMTKSNSQELISTLMGLEIKVAVIPENKIQVCTFLEPALARMREQSAGKSEADGIRVENTSKGRSIAAWLLHTVTSMIDSVFNDWYEGFAYKQGYNDTTTNQKWTNYCTYCVTSANQSLVDLNTRRITMFTSTYCCLAQSKGEVLKCRNHGELQVEEVAPDLAFCDLHPATVFKDHAEFEIKTSPHSLGEGGFGSVYKAELQKKPFDKFVPVQIAQKFINSADGDIHADDPDIVDQLKAWHTYDCVSLEARVMNKLYHKNILDFIGICFPPKLSILIELAPKGDLKSVLSDFKTERIRLSRRTIKTTLIQIAEAMDYLHSLNIIYRDLKPQNILVWKYPLPKRQWNNNEPIHIKVADYGISLEVSPQGTRGYQGSQPYLPPEVIIFGGRKAYSTQLDVYAFGMCIYYMISLQSPFTDTYIPVALREGKRPELVHKLQSHSVFITELMCWCWSELPQDRPDFPQILEILRNKSFTKLLATAPLTVDCSSSKITAACTRTLVDYELTDTAEKEMYPSVSKILSLVYRSTKDEDKNDPAVQVWYGTDNGCCEVIQFQTSGAVRKTITLRSNFKGYISCIKVISNLVWISTIGNGIHVYDSNTYKYKCSWGESEKEAVYSLLYVEEENLVLTLTSNGIYSFHSDISEDQFFDKLEHYMHLKPEFGGQGVNIGVVIPPSGRESIGCQVWVCSHKEHKFYILDPRRLNITAVVECSKTELSSIMETEEQSHKFKSSKPILSSMTTNIKDMQVLRMHHMRLAVANNWKIPLWSVKERRIMHVFDCKEHCKTRYSNISVRITSLLANEDIISVGLEGGILLSINCTTMDVLLSFHAYDQSVYSLMVMNPLVESNSKPSPQPKTRVPGRHHDDSKSSLSPLPEGPATTSSSPLLSISSTSSTITTSLLPGSHGTVTTISPLSGVSTSSSPLLSISTSPTTTTSSSSPLPGSHGTTTSPLPGSHGTTTSPLPGSHGTTTSPLPGSHGTTTSPLPGSHGTTTSPLPGSHGTTSPLLSVTSPGSHDTTSPLPGSHGTTSPLLSVTSPGSHDTTSPLPGSHGTTSPLLSVSTSSSTTSSPLPEGITTSPLPGRSSPLLNVTCPLPGHDTPSLHPLPNDGGNNSVPLPSPGSSISTHGSNDVIEAPSSPVKMPQKTPPKSLHLRAITSRMKDYLTPTSQGGKNKLLKGRSVSVETPLLLISIGRGYRSVVGSNDNHPPKFILPNSHVNQSNTKLVKPGTSTSHLLIWSTEMCGGDDGVRQSIRKRSREEDVVFDVIEQTDKGQ